MTLANAPSQNLIANNWTRSFIQPNNEESSVSTLMSAGSTQTDYHSFFGALVTSSSITIYVGAVRAANALTGMLFY